MLSSHAVAIASFFVTVSNYTALFMKNRPRSLFSPGDSLRLFKRSHAREKRVEDPSDLDAAVDAVAVDFARGESIP